VRNELVVFDCGSPISPVPIATFTIDAEGDGRLRYLPLSTGTTEVHDVHPPFLSPDEGEVRVPRHLDGTYPFSDSSPGGWGARVITSLLRLDQERLPTSAFDWLRQSKNFGSGRLAFSPDIDHVPELMSVTATHRDLTPKLLDTLFNFVEAPEASIDAFTLGVVRPGCDLGGVRPKTLVSHEGREYIIKFGLPNDCFDVPIAEYAALRLAHLSGVSVPSFELTHVGSQSGLLIERFDRTEAGERIHYFSAYSLLNPGPVRQDGTEYKEGFSYGAIAEALHTFGDPTKVQGHELFRRMIVNIMVGNVDDHLRNHAVLVTNGTVELSPAFDICPHPEAPFRPQSVGVGAFGRASTVPNALSQCTRFALTPPEAWKIVSDVKDVVSAWRQVFTEAGASRADLRRLTPCFAVAEQADAVNVNLSINVQT